jgi:hypothetical protein
VTDQFAHPGVARHVVPLRGRTARDSCLPIHEQTSDSRTRRVSGQFEIVHRRHTVGPTILRKAFASVSGSQPYIGHIAAPWVELLAVAFADPTSANVTGPTVFITTNGPQKNETGRRPLTVLAWVRLFGTGVRVGADRGPIRT